MNVDDRVKWRGRDDLHGTVLRTLDGLAQVHWDNAKPRTSWHALADLEILIVEEPPVEPKPKREDVSDAHYHALQVLLRDLIERRVEYTYIGTDLKRTGRLRSVEGRVSLITFDRGTTMVASRLDRIRILAEKEEA